MPTDPSTPTDRPARPDRIGIAVIGNGRMGSLRAHLASRDPRVDFLALSDADSDKSAAVAAKVGADLHTDDNLAALLHPRVTAVIVSTPEGEHTDAICAALEAGKTVLVEKPIALSLVDADRILETLGNSQGTLHVGYTQRVRRRYVSVKEHIDAGRLGKVLMARMHIYSPRSMFQEINKRAAHASPITDGLTYVADMALWYFAPRKVVRVYAQAGSDVFPDHPRKLGDYGWAVVTFDDGSTASLGVSAILPTNWPAYVSSIGMEIFGTEGTLAINDSHTDVIVASDDPTPHPYVPGASNPVAFLGSQMPGDWALGDFYGPMREETRMFLDHVVSGKDIPVPTGPHGRDVLELTVAIEESAVAGGAVIELPLRSAP